MFLPGFERGPTIPDDDGWQTAPPAIAHQGTSD